MSVHRLRALVVTVLVTGGLAFAGGPSVVPVAHAASGPTTERFSIGTSVRGRPIMVVHRSYPGARNRVVVIGSIHGDERAGLRVIKDIKRRGQSPDLDLWLVRTVNPDGVVAHRRTNAHRVDLNRNFPYHWRSINKGTSTWSGPSAVSEPETRALRRFIKQVDPRLVITFHQPLFGVGANSKGMRIVRSLAAGMHLPVKSFSCTGACYGSFTSWVNHRLDAVAVTVEFGRTASDRRIRRAARTVLRVGAGL